MADNDMELKEEEVDDDKQTLSSKQSLEDDLDDVDGIEINGDIQQLSKFTKIIAPIFLVFALFCLIVTICIAIGLETATYLFFGEIAGILLFAAFGGWGVYKWGTVEEQIDEFKKQNNEFESGIGELRSTRNKIHDEVSQLTETTQKLQRNVESLNESLGEFDELKQSLQEICGDNEELNAMVNNINDMYANMAKTILENQRAELLASFYDASLLDKDDGMTKGEYRRFLGRLDKGTRSKFEQLGSFEELAGEDKIIDLKEFEGMVSQFLEQFEDDLVQNAGNK